MQTALQTTFRQKQKSTYEVNRKCLTVNTESWSGKWVSNPRPAAWEAAALPTELLPLGSTNLRQKAEFCQAFLRTRPISRLSPKVNGFFSLLLGKTDAL